MEFVINEWYLDWHRPDTSLENQEMARKFLNWLLASEHRIVLLRGSPFHQKLNDYRRRFDYYHMCRIYLKLFISQIFEDPAKCRILEYAPPLSSEIVAFLQRPVAPPLTNFESDRYLFESAEATREKTIVTTDDKLMLHFANNGHFYLMSVEDFFSNYNIL
ncbi:MAG: hypothetical protein IPH12_15910 [Saprospirales bacterium]|nr:hypothetical protein [Saprospirales bacterium]MBK8920078.1 hypothetical protein [Saprospirales bacterium]